MGFNQSYLGRLRAKVGHGLLLVPGAAVIAEDDNGRILLARRGDTGEWSLPTGGAEEGSSFARTALAELEEEVGVAADESDLVAYASFSDERHVFTYPNGDVTHWFTVCFVARRWSGEPRPDGCETTEVCFFATDDLPSPLHEPSAAMIDLYRRFRETGVFQIA